MHVSAVKCMEHLLSVMYNRSELYVIVVNRLSYVKTFV